MIRASDKKGAVCALCSGTGAYLSYVFFSGFFVLPAGALMDERFSTSVALFYAVIIGGMLFVLLMFFWRAPDQKSTSAARRPFRVKRFKL
jgi:hypothetical protein